MGTTSMLPVRQFLPLFPPRSDFQSAASQANKGPPAHASPVAQANHTALSNGTKLPKMLKDTLTRGAVGDPAGQFDAVLYHSQLEKVALSLRFQEVMALMAGAPDETTPSSEALVGRQLAFDFYAESRTEELMLFQQRTGAVAEGLGETRGETYVEVSRHVAARFSMSMSVSGVALTGFAGASEGLQEADEATFDRFLALAEDALVKVDDIVNRLFEVLDALFKGEGDVAALFNQFLDGLDLSSLLGFAEGGQDALGGVVQGQAFQFEMQLEFSFEFSEMVQIREAKVKESDPVTLDLDGDGIELTRFADGARFDITGAGRPVTTAFVTGGDAFLAIDRNQNGVIDDGTELFGDQNGAVNGFEELRKLDSNRDGVIDRQDAAFDSLVLFRDNGNGITEPGELVFLAEEGIAELSLRYRNVDERAAGGNRLAQLASYGRSDGSRGMAADVILNYTA